MSLYIPIAILVLVLNTTKSENIVATVSIRPDTATVGDSVQLEVQVHHSANISVNHISNPFSGVAELELQDVKDSIMTFEDGGRRQTIVFSFLPFGTGFFESDSVTVNYRSPPDSTLRIARFPGITLFVTSVLTGDEEALRAEKPPIPFEISNWLVFWTVLILLLLIGIIIFAIIYRKKRQKTLKQAPVIDAHDGPSPEERALAELEKLRRSSLLEEGQQKTFYTQASEIIRAYVEERYRVEALEMTTAQLIRNMKQRDPNNHSIEPVRRFLERCDLVKFAKLVPPVDESCEFLDTADNFITDSFEYFKKLDSVSENELIDENSHP